MSGNLMQIEVEASGMVTAVGFCTDSTCTAMRAKISGLKEVNLRDPSSGELLCGGRVPLPQWSRGLDKYADLLAAAIHQCFQTATQGQFSPEDLPIFACVAEPTRPGRLSSLDDGLLEELEFRLGVKLHPRSAIVALGRVGSLTALDRVAAFLREHHNSRCILAGVDSFFSHGRHWTLRRGSPNHDTQQLERFLSRRGGSSRCAGSLSRPVRTADRWMGYRF